MNDVATSYGAQAALLAATMAVWGSSCVLRAWELGRHRSSRSWWPVGVGSSAELLLVAGMTLMLGDQTT
jgi:hypothetical protein